MKEYFETEVSEAFYPKPHKVLIEKSVAWTAPDESMECTHEGNEWVVRKMTWGMVDGCYKITREEVVSRNPYYEVFSYL